VEKRLGEQPALDSAHRLLTSEDSFADMTRDQVRYPTSDQQSGDGQYVQGLPVTADRLWRDGQAPPSEDLVAELDGLRRRLDTLPLIEQSKGILIGYFSIDAATAFNVLRRWSSHTNIKLRDISQMLVNAASTPPRPGQPPRLALDCLITRLQGRDSPANADTDGAGLLPTL
jgi:ANTAR domain